MCISSFSNCTVGAKAPLTTADDLIIGYIGRTDGKDAAAGLHLRDGDRNAVERLQKLRREHLSRQAEGQHPSVLQRQYLCRITEGLIRLVRGKMTL